MQYAPEILNAACQPYPHGCHVSHYPQCEPHIYGHVEHVPTQWLDVYVFIYDSYLSYVSIATHIGILTHI